MLKCVKVNLKDRCVKVGLKDRCVKVGLKDRCVTLVRPTESVAVAAAAVNGFY